MTQKDKESSPYILRQATLNDMEALLAICREGFPNSMRWRGRKCPGEKWWQLVLTCSGAEAWVFRREGCVVGVMAFISNLEEWNAKLKKTRSPILRLLTIIRRPGLVVRRVHKKLSCLQNSTGSSVKAKDIYVDPRKLIWMEIMTVLSAHRRQGLARRLIECCQERTIELKRDAIKLNIVPNPSVEKLFESMGYIRTNRGRSGYIYTKILKETAG